MIVVLLLIHMFVTIAMIGVVLIQRSEGGGLGIGTSQGMGAFMSGRGTANLLTRTTAILGVIFFGLSLTLALLNRGTGGVGHSLLDTPPPPSTQGPAAAGSKLPPLVPHDTAPAAGEGGPAPAPAASAPTAPAPPAVAPPAAVVPATPEPPAAAPAKPAEPGVPTN